MVELNLDLHVCDNPKCDDPVHASAITRMYKGIIYALTDASETFGEKP